MVLQANFIEVTEWFGVSILQSWLYTTVKTDQNMLTRWLQKEKKENKIGIAHVFWKEWNIAGNLEELFQTP